MTTTTTPKTSTESATLPPDGTFPATLEVVVRGDSAIICARVETPNGEHFDVRVTRQKKFLAALRRAARLPSGADVRQLHGKRVSVVGRRRLWGGRPVWKIEKFVRLSNPEVRQPADDPPVAGDEHDERAARMVSLLEKSGAKFVRDGEQYFVVIDDGRRIAVDTGNLEYAALQHRITGLGTTEYRGKVLAQRFLFQVSRRAATSKIVRFSYGDNGRILIPVEGGKVLRITSSGFAQVENGWEGIWLEHPNGRPMPWNATLDPCEGLRKFEELLVDTIPLPSDKLRRLMALALVLVPFMRQLVKARPVIEVTGKSGEGGDGKTVSCYRPLLLFRLGDVKGDYSLAQAQRDGDVGLVVWDNVETAQLRKMAGYFMFGATGAEWARVGASKNEARPTLAVTTIEGLGNTPEMKRRLLSFMLNRDRSRERHEENVMSAIDEHRALIFRGIAEVLRQALQVDAVTRQIPMPDFADYCQLIYRLLLGYEKVAGRPGFADDIISEWARVADDSPKEEATGLYARLVEKVLTLRSAQEGTVQHLTELIQIKGEYRHGPHHGRLYVGTPTGWLTALKAVAERDVVLPDTPEGLRKRLRTLKPEDGYLLVVAEDDPDVLGRSGKRRRWGILDLESDDSSDAGVSSEGEASPEPSPPNPLRKNDLWPK